MGIGRTWGVLWEGGGGEKLTFRKLQKASISFVTSFCPSLLPHEQLGSHWTDFNDI